MRTYIVRITKLVSYKAAERNADECCRPEYTKVSVYKFRPDSTFDARYVFQYCEEEEIRRKQICPTFSLSLPPAAPFEKRAERRNLDSRNIGGKFLPQRNQLKDSVEGEIRWN